MIDEDFINYMNYLVDDMLKKADIIEDEVEYNWLVNKWYNGFKENETEEKVKFDKLCKKFNIWNLYND